MSSIRLKTTIPENCRGLPDSISLIHCVCFVTTDLRGFGSHAAIRGVHLEEAVAELKEGQSQEAMGLAEQLGDLYSKLGCYNKALDSYLTQVSMSSASPASSHHYCLFYSVLLTGNTHNYVDRCESSHYASVLFAAFLC